MHHACHEHHACHTQRAQSALRSFTLQGFADLTAQLDRHLTTDPPTHHGYGDLGDSTTADLLLREPFDPFSAAPGQAQQHGDSNHGTSASMDPFASYGSLVTPAPQQQQQQQQQAPSSSNTGPLDIPSPLHAPGPAGSPLSHGSPDQHQYQQQQDQQQHLYQQQRQQGGTSGSPTPASLLSRPGSMPHSGAATPDHADGMPSPSGAVAASRAPAADAPLHVKVTDPQKRDGQGLLGIGGGWMEVRGGGHMIAGVMRVVMLLVMVIVVVVHGGSGKRQLSEARRV